MHGVSEIGANDRQTDGQTDGWTDGNNNFRDLVGVSPQT